MAYVKVFKEKDSAKYGNNTFDNEIQHLEYLLTEYVVKEEKVLSRVWSGINCNDDPRIAYEEMMMTKTNFNKLDGRAFKHYTISFPHDESKKLGAETINKMTKEIIERIPEFNNFEISITTHEDKEHIHSHIVVNSVRLTDGHKIQLPESFLDKFKYICNEYTTEKGLSIPKKKENREGISNDNAIYTNMTNGTKTKTMEFCDKLENIIRQTKTREDLFRAMKENNMYMKWRDDRKVGDTLKIGVITIEDKNTGEKHRVDTLYRKYNLDISSNKDLIEHFMLKDKINMLKRTEMIRNIKIDKEEKIELKNIEEYINLYNEIINNIGKDTYKNIWNIDIDNRDKLLKLANIIYDNCESLKTVFMNKVEKLVIQARDLNKDINILEETNNIEKKLINVIANKILKEMLYKNERMDELKVGFFIKGIIRLMKNIDKNSLNNANNKTNKDDIQKKRKHEEDIKRAIEY